MKKEKLIERMEETKKQQLSQTLRAPYLNDKSKKMLE